jgi:threonylcarbamoyladenosine tRNA methylthiotransferase MtaB
MVSSLFNEESHYPYSMLDIKSYPEDSFNYSTAIKGSHTRSFVKIQDGCDVKCSYCKIPYARGKPISRPINEISKDIKILYNNGYREFILTGINIIYYNDAGKSLSDLLQILYNINGDIRIRLSSVEPDRITDKLLDTISHEKMGKHLHIPLQSGSDKILKLMRRRYNIKYYVNLINRIRKRYPNLNITTDLIIGFPGETTDDFIKTIEIVKECNFSHIHTFKYSKRTGTPASMMPNQINEEIKTERSNIIRNISKQQNYKFRKSQIGRESKILIEKISKEGFGTGFTNNYIRATIPDCKKNLIQQGKFILTKIKEVNHEYTIANII